MSNISYRLNVLITLVAVLSLSSCTKQDIFDPQQVQQVADRVAAWQVQAFPTMDQQRFWKSTCPVRGRMRSF